MIRTTNLYARGNRLYISAYTDYGRVRIATKLEDTPKNRDYVKANAQNIIFSHFGNQQTQIQKDVSNLRFDRIGSEFLNTLEHIRETTMLGYKYSMKQIVSFFGNKDIRVIGKSIYQDFCNNSPKKYTVLLNRIFSYCNETYNTDLKMIKRKRSVTSFINTQQKELFNLAQVKTILENASGELSLYLSIAFFTGARTGEILALRWEDIDLDEAKIQINKSCNALGKTTLPKTSTSMRFIDIIQPLKNILLAHKKESGNLFSLSRNTIRKRFNTLLSDLGLHKITLYSTRHTFASLMLSNNEEPLWVASMLGHKNLNITYSFYAKFIPEKKNRAMFLNDILAAQGE
ncbi:site-specific integrase [Helicobacter equorum]|uniref:site-specific integrase n=1 Tax=Helicobacter equorum TaxID=361872 RepID=UPI000CF08414|nr:site-specific integrase [Helicobacter equorum]